MAEKTCRISLRHFMGIAALCPPLAATVAGAFGRIPAVIGWILIVASFWYACTCLFLYLGVQIAKSAVKLTGRTNYKPSSGFEPSSSA